jgi:predicted RNase H-like HicB family nuclease
MKQLSIVVKAVWDDEARVWVAQSTDIDGLAVEADTLEELRAKVMQAIPDIIELNGLESDLPEIPVHIMSDEVHKVANPRAS